MTDYPQWLVERVAKAMYEAPSDYGQVDPVTYPWPPEHPDDRAWWDERATAALDALGYQQVDTYAFFEYWWGPGIRDEITP